jgi:hypothetical protein
VPSSVDGPFRSKSHIVHRFFANEYCTSVLWVTNNNHSSLRQVTVSFTLGLHVACFLTNLLWFDKGLPILPLTTMLGVGPYSFFFFFFFWNALYSGTREP